MSEGRDLTAVMSETPLGVRRAIVRLHKKGKTYVEVADLLGVGEATVNRILRLHRETGSVHRRPIAGGRKSPIRGHVTQLLGHILTEMPDATVLELTQALMARTDIETSRSAVQRAIHRLGFSRKKSPSGRANGTARSSRPIADSSALSWP
jgi:transposase